MYTVHTIKCVILPSLCVLVCVHRCMLQHIATHCNTLQYTRRRMARSWIRWRRHFRVSRAGRGRCRWVVGHDTHCNALLNNAAHYNTPQHTATHRNALQHVTTHCNTVQHIILCDGGKNQCTGICVCSFSIHDLLITYEYCNALKHTAPLCTTL